MTTRNTTAGETATDSADYFHCAICLEQRRATDDCETLTCNHSFCKECIGRWRKSGSTCCPMCRGEAQYVRIYLDGEHLPCEILLLSQLQQAFGDRICEPLSVCAVDPDTNSMSLWSLLIVPETLLTELDNLFDSYQMRRVTGAPAAVGRRALSVIANAENNACFILQRADSAASESSTSGSAKPLLSAPMVQLKRQMTQRLFNDRRLAQMRQNNAADVARSLFPLFCRMLEFELAEQQQQQQQQQQQPMTSADDSAPPALQVSTIQRAIVQENLTDAYDILNRHGDDWIRIASKLPRSEVEHVARATKNLRITMSATGSERENSEGVAAAAAAASASGRETTENEARSIILWQRFRNPVCACCWRHDQATTLMCCSRCESTLYCSEQCRDIDWPTHAKWCCNPDAKRVRGALEMVIGAPNNLPESHAVSQTAETFPFTPQMLQDAIGNRN